MLQLQHNKGWGGLGATAGSQRRKNRGEERNQSYKTTPRPKKLHEVGPSDLVWKERDMERTSGHLEMLILDMFLKAAELPRKKHLQNLGWIGSKEELH